MIQGLRKAPTEQDLANCAIVAIACALIPYCLARAVTESARRISSFVLVRIEWTGGLGWSKSLNHAA